MCCTADRSDTSGSGLWIKRHINGGRRSSAIFDVTHRQFEALSQNERRQAVLRPLKGSLNGTCRALESTDMAQSAVYTFTRLAWAAEGDSQPKFPPFARGSLPFAIGPHGR